MLSLTLSNLKNAKFGAVCGQKAPDRRGCRLKCVKTSGEHLPGVMGTGVEAAGVNMRCRHAADLAPLLPIKGAVESITSGCVGACYSFTLTNHTTSAMREHAVDITQLIRLGWSALLCCAAVLQRSRAP